MNITIKAKNIVDLHCFIPVQGTWVIEDKQDKDSINNVEESIVNWINSSLKL